MWQPAPITQSLPIVVGALDHDVRIDDGVGADRHRVLDVRRRRIEDGDAARHQPVEDAAALDAAATASCLRSLTPSASARIVRTVTASTRAPARAGWR